MVGRNLITITMSLVKVTGAPEAALIHVSLPLVMDHATQMIGETSHGVLGRWTRCASD